MSKAERWNSLVIPTPQELAGVPKDTPVLLAFSGGADSRALLHILAGQAERNGFSLTLAHVNHGIRGDEALRDRDFCVETAARYGVELCLEEVDVPALAAMHGKGLEEEARRVRYGFFERLMRERSIPLLVTAHHADDQLETLLFRLCRGTGAKGLCGISPVRTFSDVGFLVRPLLTVRRCDILDFCRAEHLAYVVDSTNRDTAYARNRIRAEVVPVFESLFDDPQRRAAALSEGLREDEEYLSSLAERFLSRIESDAIPIAALSEMAKPVIRRILMQWTIKETGYSPERVHVEALMRLIESSNVRGEVALTGGYTAGIESGRLMLFSEKREAAPYRVAFCEGNTVISEAGFCICVEKLSECTKINNLSIQSGIILYLKSDIMKSGLFWRSRQEGDLLFKGGMHRKLRRLYRDAGVSPRMRDRIPLLCDGDGIVWAPCIGVRDGLEIEGDAYQIHIKTV